MRPTSVTTETGYSAFFKAVTGRPPRAFQMELARRFRLGDPPETLAAGTGMGKTLAVILAWVWALAMDLEHGTGARRVPLRLFMVVDRRVVVDGTYDVARTVLSALEDSTDPAAVEVRRILSEQAQVAPGSLDDAAGPGGPVDLVRLRGSMDRRPETTRSPIRPLICVGTMDQVLSRLLYRAYLTSPLRRSIEAALVGTDALIVLDEAHLARQAYTTLNTLQQHQLAQESSFGGTIPLRQVMTMTATPFTVGSDRVLTADMDAERDADPDLGPRIDRRRRMEFRQVTTSESLVQAMRREVSEMRSALDTGRLLLVFLTVVKDARQLARELGRASTGWEAPPRVRLATGGMPEHATTTLLEDLSPFMTGAHDRADAEPMIVVSTSTLEVGADLDADWMVTAPCDAASLIQRIGRINRAGTRDSGSVAIISPTGGAKDPIHGPAADAVLASTTGASSIGEVEDLLTGPSTVGETRRADPEPAVIPHHVFHSYRRTTGSRNDLPVSPWVRALDGPGADVSIVFREAVRELDDDDALLAHLQEQRPDTRTEL